MFCRLPILASSLLFLLLAPLHAGDIWAPGIDQGPVDQLDIAGNACGPAALFAAIRCGNEQWRGVARRFPGRNDKGKLLYIIKAHGLRASESLRGRNRWTRHGINPEDLGVIANELAGIRPLPPPRSDDLFIESGESPTELVKRTHQALKGSLQRGFPPVLSLRRYALGSAGWSPVKGHFVTVVRVPDRIPRNAQSFEFTYFDPWGGTRREGTIRLPSEPVLASPSTGQSPCLEAVVPGARIGLSEMAAGTSHLVVPTYLTARW